MARLSLLFALFLAGLTFTLASPLINAAQPHTEQVSHAPKSATAPAKSHALPAPFCYPSLGFLAPDALPLDNSLWWCDPATEYAFVGFSYEVTACEYPCFTSMVRTCLALSFAHIYLQLGQSRAQLHKEFRDIRQHFNSRYVRLYGACDREGF